jgi:hypothetical protein
MYFDSYPLYNCIEKTHLQFIYEFSDQTVYPRQTSFSLFYIEVLNPERIVDFGYCMQ